MASAIDKASLAVRRLPWGFLGMVGTILLVEHLISVHEVDLTSLMQWDWKVTGKAVIRPSRVEGRDILCFGDSLLKFGLMPKVIEKRTGERAVNFAVHTGQTPSSYFLFRRALRAGAKPSAILLDLTPHMLMQSPRSNQLLWADLLSVKECLDLTFQMQDPDYLASILVAESLPSFKLRHEIRATIRAAFGGRILTNRFTIHTFLRNWRINEGAMLFTDSAVSSLDVKEWVTILYSKWKPDPVNVAYLERFLQLASDHQIPVYWLLPPIHPEIQARTESSGFDGDYSKFVKTIRTRYPLLTVVDARYAQFAADHFRDGIHLNRRGSLKLSTVLADFLHNCRGNSSVNSWVKLEPTRVEPFNLPLEDVEQSALIVRDQGTSLVR